MVDRIAKKLMCALCWCLLMAGVARAEAVADLISLQGSAPIMLEGTGIVTGLSNTGDKSVAAQTLLRKFLSNSNIDLDASAMSTGNVAIVRVNAELPAFMRPGQKFSVTVSSFGDAKSLAGGELLACDLYVPGGDNQPYARATGQVITGSGILTRGTIQAGANSGALQLRTYPFGRVMSEEGLLRLNLKRANWADASTIARQINQTPSLNPNLVDVTMFAESEPTIPVAIAKDAGQVVVRVPNQFRHDVTRYISSILEVPVAVNRPAKILVNRARNAIVVTGDIRVNNAVVSLQDKMVTVRPETEDEPAAYTLGNDTPRSVVELEGPGTYADLQGLIDTLNAMGLTTEQVITIFEQLLASGAINAELTNQ